MGLLSWLRDETVLERAVGPERELRHTDTSPSAYPLEWKLDSVVWHQNHGDVSAVAVPAVYAAIDLIASSIARLNTVETTPLTRRPDVFDSRFSFFFEAVWSLCWHGNAFWMVSRTERGVDNLQVLPPSEVGVTWDERMPRVRRRYTWNGSDLPPERIRHLRFHPRPGELLGLSPITAARLTWDGAAFSEAWGSRLFSDSGIPSGVLSVPTLLSSPEAKELKEQWTASRSGLRDTAVLSGGAKYEPVELSPADIEWLETRASNAQEVARIFHIPGDLLEIAIQGGASSVTYRNLAEVGADFVTYCLSTYIRIIEEAWASLPGQPSVSFDTAPLYQESLETRARTLQMLVTTGADPDGAAAECGFSFGVTPRQPSDTPSPSNSSSPIPQEVDA